MLLTVPNQSQQNNLMWNMTVLSSIQDSHRIILEQRAVRTREKIMCANVGEISTDDPYMIQLDGAPYETEAAITTLQGTMPPMVVSKGEWLCDAFYWYKVPHAKR
jgi:hypothetical protein